METTILLVCREGDSLRAYLRELEKQPIRVEVANTMAALEPMLVEMPFNGLLLDMDTMFQARNEEKDAARSLLELYPVIRVRWDEEHDSIMTLYYGEVGEGSVSLDDFIWKNCATFQGRSIRRSVRRQLHLNVLVAPDSSFAPGTVVKANTMDVSEDGCFLQSVEDWGDRPVAWLQLADFADKTPVMAYVRWSCVWGTANRLPGLGLEFAGLTEAQRVELHGRIFPYAGGPDRTG